MTFKMAYVRHLEFLGPIMGSLKSPIRTSYRSSIETIAVNCLVFLENHFFVYTKMIDRQTDERMDGQHQHVKPLTNNSSSAAN